MEYSFCGFSPRCHRTVHFPDRCVGRPGTDLPTVLAVLVDNLRAAVPSLLGLTVTITEAGDAVTLTAAEPGASAAAAGPYTSR